MMKAPCDTIVVNDSILDVLQRSRDYDYARELVPNNEVNYFDRFWRYLEDLFKIDDTVESIAMNIPEWGWWFFGGLVVMAVGFLIWKYRVKLFTPRDFEHSAQEITEDDINEVDFDQLIAEAEKNSDYLMLCRLRYLQTLKAASDAGLVSWRRYKTPTQYAMEWNDEDFAIMTNHFLRIRYGHYSANAELAEEMHSRQEIVMERIAKGIDKKKQTNQKQEGGELS